MTQPIMNGLKYYVCMLTAVLLFSGNLSAQCCAGGAGSPIAGGTSQGVLMKDQIELNTNFQFISSDKFYKGDSPDTNKYFDQFKSTYQYFRLAFGVTEKLTMSVETGNYFQKKELGLNNDASKTYTSSGFSDLIIFPRYNVLNRHTATTKTDLTLGLGFKIPIGSYNDSTGIVEPFSGKTIYITNPQAVQPTTGAQDVIFYAFFFRGYPVKNIRFFANALYIRKGWNPLGERMGDFASIGLFAGKTFFNDFGLTLQVRGEMVGRMTLNKNILLYAYPNYDPEATGFKKVFVTPQVSYSKGKFTLYALADIPVYQYVNKIQVGTQLQVTTGLSFRFFATKAKFVTDGSAAYFCPMHPEVTSTEKSTCPKCGMDLEKR